MIKNPLLRRFWIEFVRMNSDPAMLWSPPSACGVTAYTYGDAISLMHAYFGIDKPLPPIQTVKEDVDVSLLELWPSFTGVPIWRGVWYPHNGYGVSDRLP